jgi:hypothetical protein
MEHKAEEPSSYWQKRGNFHPFSLKHCLSVYIYKKLKKQWKIIITIIGSSPNTGPSNNITVSQS